MARQRRGVGLGTGTRWHATSAHGDGASAWGNRATLTVAGVLDVPALHYVWLEFNGTTQGATPYEVARDRESLVTITELAA